MKNISIQNLYVQARNRLRNQYFLRSVGGLSLASFVAQGIGLCNTVIMARFFSPESIGVLGVYIAVATIIGVISLYSYQLAIPNVVEGYDLQALVVTLFVICAVSACLVLVFSLAVGYKYAGALALIVGAQAMNQISDLLNIRTQHFVLIMIGRVMPAVLFLAALTVVIHSSKTPSVLIYSHLLAVSFAATVYSYASIFSRLSKIELKNSVGWESIKKTLLAHASFSAFLAPSQLFHMMSYHLPIILIERFLGPAVAAQYLMTLRFCMNPVSMIGNAIAQTYHGKLADTVISQKREGYIQFRRLNKALIALAAVSAITMFILFPPILKVLLGPGWALTTNLVKVFSPLYGIMLLGMPLSVLFLVFKEQKFVFKNQLAGLVISLVSFGVAIYFHDLMLGAFLFSVLGFLRYVAIYHMQRRVAFRNLA